VSQLVSLEPVNILQNEIIGLNVEVLHDSNPLNIHVRGKVIDETMKTLVIKNTKIQRIAKQNAILEINIDNRKITVEGKNLIGKPENRVKKQNKRKW
jgi:ribonuclease P protein subunit POP4